MIAWKYATIFVNLTRPLNIILGSKQDWFRKVNQSALTKIISNTRDIFRPKNISIISLPLCSIQASAPDRAFCSCILFNLLHRTEEVNNEQYNVYICNNIQGWRKYLDKIKYCCGDWYSKLLNRKTDKHTGSKLLKVINWSVMIKYKAISYCYHRHSDCSE